MYKEIEKIKEYLMIQGYSKNVPVDQFERCLMILFGMKKETVLRWNDWFVDNKLITIVKGKVNFID